MRYFRFSSVILAAGLVASSAMAQTATPLPPVVSPPQPQAMPGKPAEAKPAQPAPARPAQAQTQRQSTPTQPKPPVVEAALPKPANKLDPLFDALKRERDPDKARGIASQILSNLNDSGSATVNLLMQWAATAIKEKRNAAALDFLDQVTVLDPDYAEGWNRRATLHYTMGNARKSMADIAEVLKREPRHFGALAGMAGILMESGKDQLALKAWEDYLAVYPADRDAQEAVSKLSEKIAGNRT